MCDRSTCARGLLSCPPVEGEGWRGQSIDRSSLRLPLRLVKIRKVENRDMFYVWIYIFVRLMMTLEGLDGQPQPPQSERQGRFFLVFFWFWPVEGGLLGTELDGIYAPSTRRNRTPCSSLVGKARRVTLQGNKWAGVNGVSL